KIESAATASPSSVRVTGTAAAAVMGMVRARDGGGGLKGYAWGYKDISGINGGSSGTTPLVNTLGKLLGDCSTTPKTLTVTIDGGAPVDVVFNTDLTAASNASILSTINAALGSAATASEYAVDQGEAYPRSDHEAILLNDGPTGIGRWNAVKWGGNRRSARLVTTADAASAFMGVALEPIPPGSYGRVLLRGKLFAASGVEGQIPGVTALSPGDAVSLSGSVDGQFVVGSSKQVGVASDTNIFAFNA
ncbi:hypothetical protein SK224_16700, partial [Microbacterium sp. BG28]|uniref:hypothetical protein n=1 Tax=Microbacterium sp. BG28 TaxID=3097356 RepID=UPI002A59B4A1